MPRSVQGWIPATPAGCKSLMNSSVFFLRDFFPQQPDLPISANLKRLSQSVPPPFLFPSSCQLKYGLPYLLSPRKLVDSQGIAPLSGLIQVGTFLATRLFRGGQIDDRCSFPINQKHHHGGRR